MNTHDYPASQTGHRRLSNHAEKAAPRLSINSWARMHCTMLGWSSGTRQNRKMHILQKMTVPENQQSVKKKHRLVSIKRCCRTPLQMSIGGENDYSNILKEKNDGEFLDQSFLSRHMLGLQKRKHARCWTPRHRDSPVHNRTLNGTNNLAYSHRLPCKLP